MTLPLEQLANIAPDLLFAAVVIWLVLQLQRQFAETLDKRQTVVDHLTEVVANNTAAIYSIKDCMVTHEANASQARGEIANIADDTTYIRKRLDEHHEAVMERLK